MRTEILSHPLCPFQHRLRLLAAWAGETHVEFAVIPYPDFPRRVREISPSGETPVLLRDGAFVSDRSDHIADFLIDGREGELLGRDRTARLALRARQAAADAALHRLRSVFTARDVAALRTALDALFASLAAEERRGILSDVDAGAERLDSAAWAGFASLIHDFPALRGRPDWDGVPRATAMIDALTARADVAAHRAAEPQAAFAEFFAMTGSAFPHAIAQL